MCIRVNASWNCGVALKNVLQRIQRNIVYIIVRPYRKVPLTVFPLCLQGQFKVVIRRQNYVIFIHDLPLDNSQNSYTFYNNSTMMSVILYIYYTGCMYYIVCGWEHQMLVVAHKLLTFYLSSLRTEGSLYNLLCNC